MDTAESELILTAAAMCTAACSTAADITVCHLGVSPGVTRQCPGGTKFKALLSPLPDAGEVVTVTPAGLTATADVIPAQPRPGSSKHDIPG